MFDILMYLFENIVHSDVEVLLDHDELTDELTRAGFHQDEIYKALDWLEKLAELQMSESNPYLANVTIDNTFRIYTAEEKAKLDNDCIGWLMFLQQINILNTGTREMVIDRVMELDSPEFCLEDLKWVVLMVLFNVPGSEKAYAQMEDLLFDEQDGPLH